MVNFVLLDLDLEIYTLEKITLQIWPISNTQVLKMGQVLVLELISPAAMSVVLRDSW